MNRKAALFLVLLFLALALLVNQRHEMWRDELHSWLIARDSASVPELLHHKRHEGHPGLWYLLLFAVSRATGDPRAMQALHLLIASGTAYLCLRFAPLSRWQRVVFIFGYYPFYEYAVLSRNYAAGILCATGFCVLLRGGRKNHLPAALLLLLLMQTSFHGLVLGSLLGLLLLYLRVSGPPEEGIKTAERWRTAAVAGLLLAGAAISLKVMIPPPDVGIYTGGHPYFKLERALRVLALFWRSYLPIPGPGAHFWNTNILDPLPLWQLGLGLALFAYFCLVLLRRRALLAVYVSGSVVYLLFHYLKFFGYSRHHGHLFWLLFFCLWLDSCLPGALSGDGRAARWPGFFRRGLPAVVSIILLANLAGAVIAAGEDWRRPFSANRAAAEYIRAEGLNQLPIAGDVDDAVLAFSHLLGRPIYYPRSDTTGTYVTYDRNVRWRKMKVWGILTRIEEEMRRRGGEILVILNYRLQDRREFELWNREVEKRIEETGNAAGRLVPVKEFTDTIVPDEHYFLYRMVPAGMDPAYSNPGRRSESSR